MKEILNLNPKKLVLVEFSEPNLWQIHENLKAIVNNNIEIVPILADVCNRNSLSLLLKINSVDIVFHAAAYKHVSLVEKNPLQGLKNNIFLPRFYAEAFKLGIKKVVLISSDKAVRPMNVMGLSKEFQN